MKILTILLVILLTATACAAQPAAAPVPPPSPSSAAPTQAPIPITAPDNTPVVGVGSSGSAGGASGGASSVCVCPTNAAPPAHSDIQSINPPPAICNCPAIIITPPQPLPGVDATPQAIPANGITLADNGMTFSLHPGESFLLNLGNDIFDWTVEIDNQNVLSRVKNIMVINGAQGVYEANSPGQAVLTASGDPFCRKSTPACMAPSMLFTVTVIVE